MSERISRDIQPHAQAALRSSPIYALRSLRVDQDHENALLISGTVESYYHKQLAQELVRTIAPSVAVVNLIHVEDVAESEADRSSQIGVRRPDGDTHPPAKARPQRSAN